jgi:hypothetical protein
MPMREKVMRYILDGTLLLWPIIGLDSYIYPILSLCARAHDYLRKLGLLQSAECYSLYGVTSVRNQRDYC